MLIGEAIDKAIDECINEDVLKELLLKHRAEAKEHRDQLIKELLNDDNQD